MGLTERERRIADALAQAMAHHVDANEVGKVLAFWRRWRDPGKVFALVERLPRSGLVRTGRTRGYYEAMGRAFNQHLRNIRPEAFGAVLAWAFRLMRYYQLEQGRQEHSRRRRSR
ncbi:MAG: hypothetical protein DRI79_00220 [Chloroflexi bacterium]|nr:MAG: hypothetical protein DRI79_00220 [Chloroflexota bacterium]